MYKIQPASWVTGEGFFGATPVSTPDELQNDKLVCGHGAPTHTPSSALSIQLYVNVDAGTKHFWFGGAFHLG